MFIIIHIHLLAIPALPFLVVTKSLGALAVPLVLFAEQTNVHLMPYSWAITAPLHFLMPSSMKFSVLPANTISYDCDWCHHHPSQNRHLSHQSCCLCRHQHRYIKVDCFIFKIRCNNCNFDGLSGCKVQSHCATSCNDLDSVLTNPREQRKKN